MIGTSHPFYPSTPHRASPRTTRLAGRLSPGTIVVPPRVDFGAVQLSVFDSTRGTRGAPLLPLDLYLRQAVLSKHLRKGIRHHGSDASWRAPRFGKEGPMPDGLFRFYRRALFPGALFALVAGCSTPWLFRGDGEVEAPEQRREEIRGKLTSANRPVVLAEFSSPAMLTLARLQNVGLVTQLHGTGGEVAPGILRDRLLAMMRRNEVEKPNALLDHTSTALVAVKAAVPPASRKGDRIDVVITVPEAATATDLADGWLLETPLMEMQSLDGQIRESFEYMRAEGPIVTAAQVTGEDSEKAHRTGIILGGGRLRESRELGIILSSEYADALTMAAVIPAINKRFTYFDGHTYKGVATPREDSYIEVAVPERYRLDPYHFINTVLHVGFNESESDRASRMETLAKQVLDPITVRKACWQLEAIGEEAVETLALALESTDPEVRFYAAHSLAYLNDRRAIEPLVNLCRSEPAFRAMCLNGLAVMDHYEAADALQDLLHAADAEVRYGALRALRLDDDQHPETEGEQVHGVGALLEIPTTGPPLVVASLSRVPEVVIFGESPAIYVPAFHYVNRRILMAPTDDGQLRISHFEPGQEDRIAECPRDLRSVLLAIAEVGGKYGDWIQFLREAHAAGYFVEPLAINPVPTSGRVYQRGRSIGVRPAGSPFNGDSRPTVSPTLLEAEEIPTPPRLP
ncbi:MAG: hypothetical protein D6753_14795 [Planctomycetota bacterium]|nr:MAG: hypothetical protein D6753_14795 [Planctomycetota bacterium]